METKKESPGGCREVPRSEDKAEQRMLAAEGGGAGEVWEAGMALSWGHPWDNSASVLPSLGS